MNKIIYLDAAASALKPKSVIDAEVDFLQNNYANSGRGICPRSAAVDSMVEDARNKVAKHINATNSDGVIFTGGTTDGMNRIVNILKQSKAFGADSVVVVSDLDHHSARLPWEEQAYLNNCVIKVCLLDSEFNIDLSNIDTVDVLVINAMSNVLGTPQDVQKIIKTAKSINPNVITIVDAAQYIAYLSIDVDAWDCDFLCFSGHKIGADTGLGIMYIKEPQKWQVDKLGGGMVAKVSKNTGKLNTTSEWTLARGPAKFEAGTLPLTQIAGLSFAIDELAKSEKSTELIRYLYDGLSEINKIKMVTKPDACMLTFVVNGMHCLDFGSLAGAHGLCLRVGNMCASWLHNAIGHEGTIRISVGPWNTKSDMDQTIDIIRKIVK